ncbi:zinc ABC transporter substrate-binding protein [Paenibacillus tritici]|uniref:metal ABC transporter substrate-binding protein n=1 Tax=Paenibacillus tritici TaxID=1873425 RepID=UPI001BA90026|nr:metal ABC transporter substrate-binding protein [Paenibacillus tritici]QUL56933.1 zinc ABC transporter substrate-binding protein [Paenibacillus tritici]
MLKFKFKIRPVAALSLTAMLMIAGCGSNTAGNAASTGSSAKPSATEAASAPAADRLNIKASFYPMYEFTKNITGGLADVELLIPAGIEPHDWEPTAKDMAGISDADVLVYNGAGMEGWAQQVIDGASGSSLIAVEASKGLEIMEGSEAEHDHGHAHEESAAGEAGHEHSHEEAAAGEAGHDHEHSHGEAGAGEADRDHEHSHEEAAAGEAGHDHEHSHEGAAAGEAGHDHEHDHGHDHGGLDPHVWLDPVMAIREVRTIEAALSAASPGNAAAFKANSEAYIAKLQQLDQEFRDILQNTKRKDFITQHAAFGYLAQQYGLTQVPIAGLSPEQEPTAAQMAEIVDFAKANDVTTIFFETLVSSSVADAIAQEIGAKTAVLNPLEGLSDEESRNQQDYLSIMRQNLEALSAALNE